MVILHSVGKIMVDKFFFLSRLVWLGRIVILSTCRILVHFYAVHLAIGFLVSQSSTSHHGKPCKMSKERNFHHDENSNQTRSLYIISVYVKLGILMVLL